jgi:CDP-diacylglycerol--serine O-phosphatidyltransferase
MPRVSFSKARRLAVSMLPFRRPARPDLGSLPRIAVSASDFETLLGPAAYRLKLFDLIAQARIRILLSALYLQDDEAGRAVLAALHAAKAAKPDLQVAVFVDWHRAQRGLIGKTRSAGNAALYRDLAKRLGPGIPVLGVPVQTRELMGVMHLKGFVLDDHVLYSGASLNEVYLHHNDRYRLDRYHLIRNRALADSLAELMTQVFLPEAAVHTFDGKPGPTKAAHSSAIAHFRRRLKQARYSYIPAHPSATDIGITPLLGLGRSGNELNNAILELLREAREQIVLFTPYFNLPWAVKRMVRERLQAGCHTTIILGDKTANDFYLPPEEPFKTIGVLPYLYETNLRRFCKIHRRAIEAGLLEIRLWKDGDNTFHLKGLWVDRTWSLLTGNNLNPRAWRLDLENGLLIHDPHHHLVDQHQRELAMVLAHTKRLESYEELETPEAYPAPAQRLLKRLTRSRMDRLVGQVL